MPDEIEVEEEQSVASTSDIDFVSEKILNDKATISEIENTELLFGAGSGTYHVVYNVNYDSTNWTGNKVSDYNKITEYGGFDIPPQQDVESEDGVSFVTGVVVDTSLSVACIRSGHETYGQQKFFAGWNTSSDGTGTSYRVGEVITGPNSDFDSSNTLTLYAMWADGGMALWTVAYDSNLPTDGDYSFFRSAISRETNWNTDFSNDSRDLEDSDLSFNFTGDIRIKGRFFVGLSYDKPVMIKALVNGETKVKKLDKFNTEPDGSGTDYVFDQTLSTYNSDFETNKNRNYAFGVSVSTLSSIKVKEGTALKTTYLIGETLNVDDLVIIPTYEDETTGNDIAYSATEFEITPAIGTTLALNHNNHY